jgi:hypothetical protein
VLLAGGRRWDQIDLADPARPVLMCVLDELDAL